MSQEMQITIAAKDEASKVMKGIEQKVKKFGSDFGRSMASIVAPMTIVNFAMGKLQQYMDDIAKKKEEAFDWAASLSDSAEKMDVTIQAMQGLQNASTETGESLDRIGKAYKAALDRLNDARAGDPLAIKGLEAIGIAAKDLEKATPEDVMRRIGLAMEAAVNPTEAAQIAITALGKSAEGLQDILKKGFDIAGAMIDTEGLTDAEAAVVRAEALEKRKEANREKLKTARQGIFERGLDKAREGDAGMTEAIQGGLTKSGSGRFFRSSAEGEQSINDAVNKIVELEAKREADRKAAERERRGAQDTLGGKVSGAEMRDNLIREQARQKKEAEDKIAAEKAAKEKKENDEKIAKEKAAAEVRREKAIADDTKKRAAELAKEIGKEDDKEKTGRGSAGITVSSLREIGGGIAGEGMGGIADIAKQQLETQKQMVEKLDGILKMQAPPTNQFTNPDFTSGRTGVGVA